MNATSDKAYIDAKIAAKEAAMVGDVNLRLAKIDARFDSLELTLRTGFQAIRDEMALQQERIEVRLAQFQSEIIKWVVATVIGGIAVTVSLTSIIVSNSTGKATSATPMVFYIQPLSDPSVQRSSPPSPVPASSK